jgi:uncharacterized membrane protein
MVLQVILYRIPWLAIAAFSFLLFYVCLFYWTFAPDVNFLLVKQNLVSDPAWRTVFYFHVFAGMLVVFTGPLQFLGWLRRNYLKVHRAMGKIYISAVLFIGAPTGLYMAFFAEGGMWAGAGFMLMSMAWFYTTWKAFTAIKNRNITAHVQWMVRSYAMSFSAVTLRILVPVLSLGLEWQHNFVVCLTAWISWMLNLAIAEILIQRKSKLLNL